MINWILINDCINIENNIQDINKVENELKHFHSIDYTIKFSPENEEINKFLETIKNFGKLNTNIKNIINKEEDYEKMLNKIAKNAFDSSDINKTGFINQREMENSLIKISEDIKCKISTIEEIKKFNNYFEKNNGRINYYIFFTIVKKLFGKLFINEKECYCKMINKILMNEPDLKDKLPINHKTNEIFEKIKDCTILAKLINIYSPGTIDERAIIKEKNINFENLQKNFNLIINSAISIGCTVDITANDILNEDKFKIINLLYEILNCLVLKKISIENYPQLLRLKEDRETDEELLKIGQKDLLIRWFNYHLNRAGHPKQNK